MCDGAKDVEDQFPGSRGRVDTLFQRHQRDIAGFEQFHCFQEFFERSAKPVQAHHTEDIRRTRVVKESGKPWPVETAPADHVLEDTQSPADCSRCR